MQTIREKRHWETARRLNGSMAVTAVLFQILIIVGAGVSGRSITIIAGTAALLLPFNTWVSLVVLKTRGLVFAEILRMIVNTAVGVIGGHYLGWPVPVWLWLPFVGVSFEAFDGKSMWALLLGMCAAYAGAAILDGVSWIYPATFTVLAVFFRVVAGLRLDITRKLLEDSEAQRRELDTAHRSLTAVNERLVLEMGARAHAELELRQAQKLEAVGRLAAGVAHEINTPLQFIGDSLTFVQEALSEGLSAPPKISSQEDPEEMESTAREMVDAVAMALDGVGRVSKIVSSLKEFAHPERRESAPLDVNRALLTTLTVAKHEYKYAADIITDFDDVPAVECNTGEINQVFLNLIVNAAHAIEDAVSGTAQRGTITLRTRNMGGAVEISITDTGAGIPDEVRDHIFEPFFTTKEIGRGTGQGLAIARSIVTERHGGHLSFETSVGHGTTFRVSLPLVRKRQRVDSSKRAA